MEVIRERLGSYAQYVVINSIVMPEQSDKILVTNTNASGEGSLRAAIALLNTYTSGEAVTIEFAEELQGSTVTLASD